MLDTAQALRQLQEQVSKLMSSMVIQSLLKLLEEENGTLMVHRFQMIFQKVIFGSKFLIHKLRRMGPMQPILSLVISHLPRGVQFGRPFGQLKLESLKIKS